MLVYVGRSSCQQLTTDSIQKRKASLAIVTAPGNKISWSKASNEWLQSMFGNKLMTALVVLKTMKDQQSARGSWLEGGTSGCTVYEIMHWEQSWLQYVQRSTPTLEAGGNWYTTQCWKPCVVEALCRSQMDHNWLHQYHNWLYWYTDYSTPFTVNQSLSDYNMQSPTYIECYSVFPS